MRGIHYSLGIVLAFLFARLRHKLVGPALGLGGAVRRCGRGVWLHCTQGKELRCDPVRQGREGSRVWAKQGREG